MNHGFSRIRADKHFSNSNTLEESTALMQKTLMGLVFLPFFLVSCKSPEPVQLEQLFHISAPGWAHSVALYGGDVYVAGREGGFSVFDGARGYQETSHPVPIRDVISLSPDSGTPVLAAGLEGLVLLAPDGTIADRYACGQIVNAVEVRGSYAFAAGGSLGLLVAKLDPGHLRLIAELPTKGWSHDVQLSRDQALLADWTYGLRVVDIRDPQKPAEISSLPSPATCISIAIRESGGKRMLALAEGHAGIALVQLDSAGHPSLIGRNYLGLNPKDPVHPRAGGWVHSVAWADRYLFAANWKRGLAVLDTTSPEDPRIILEVPTSGTALGVKTERQPDGSYLIFLADGESGLRIYRFRY
jgi:hypothetical protein